ncbi:hypothetical protein BROUX41_003798 [Berkeleyomyces rouxiae]|uniref:uncharacterized protein n=1 Tax=Berkeleyomyces rouxiae TaxID=2035830 RepID=UPI003B7B9102
MSTKDLPPPSDFEASSRGTLTPSPAPTGPSELSIPSTVVKSFVGLRSGLNLLSLAIAVAMLGLSAKNLHVYNQTHLAADFLLPLWPASFNIRPAVAMVVVGAVVTVLSSVAAGLERARNPSCTIVAASAALSLLSFVAAMTAVIVHYTANSGGAETVHTWSCEWKHVSMFSAPNFADLCMQSRAAAGLAVALMPLHVLVLAAVLLGFVADKAGSWRGRGRGCREEPKK